ncbi:hypothetical protein X753_13115 [Mesorhizobium sp. LNJC399B00]|nr:hypothetical protein X753_13115 [Mesorhizobium sp. LNJC399B00]
MRIPPLLLSRARRDPYARSEHMRFVEIFTDVLTALLLALFVCGIFAVFGGHLVPPRYAKMVLLPDLDRMTTASSTPSLPDSIDLQVQKRPEVQRSAGVTQRAVGLEPPVPSSKR